MNKSPKVIVIGSGLAGLFFSIKLAERNPKASIYLATKDILGECNSRYASGGIAASRMASGKDGDSVEKHFEDTVKAGCGLNNKSMVAEIVNEAPGIIRELIGYGVEFDQSKNKQFDLHLEGGHRCNRIYHKRDETGFEIITKLLDKARRMDNIKILEAYVASELLIDENSSGKKQCIGALFFKKSTNEMLEYRSDAVILATGGAGQVYGCTTNWSGATGDGIAMALRAGANISGMEFIQFHPTALFEFDGQRKYLITEALRGNGAKIVNEKGEAFLEKVVDKAELAPRHMVSMAIAEELERSKAKSVYLDCSSIDAARLQHNFTSFWRKCQEIGIDPTKDKVPVVPAAHFVCGGIDVERDGSTSIKGLFALGECANSGMHGANRLASNSLLEAIVISDNCAEVLALTSGKEIKEMIGSVEKIKNRADGNSDIYSDLKKRINKVMDKYASVIRTFSGLRTALNLIIELECEFLDIHASRIDVTEEIELQNLFTISKEIIISSLKRRESIGCFILTEKDVIF